MLSTAGTRSPCSSNFWGRFTAFQLRFLRVYHFFSTLNHLKIDWGGDYFNDLMFGGDEKEEERLAGVIESVLQRGILLSA